MVQLIVGKKGKGKTKELLDRVNKTIKSVNGNVVYLDKNGKHMYELNNKVRLIDVSNYPLTNEDVFVGFINGIISQDHDLEEMYLDSFLNIAKLEQKDNTTLLGTIHTIEALSERFGITFTLSISLDADELPEELKDKIIVSL